MKIIFKIFVITILVLCKISCTASNKSKYNKDDVWIVKGLIFLTEKPDTKSKKVIFKFLDKNKFVEVEIIDNKIIQSGSHKVIKVRYKDKIGYISLANLFLPKEAHEKITKLYSNPKSPLPKYKKLIGENFNGGIIGLYSAEFPIKVTEFYNYTDEHHVDTFASLKKKYEKHTQDLDTENKRDMILTDYVIFACQLDYDIRHAFIIAAKHTGYKELEIKNVYPVKVQKNKIGVSQMFTTQVITYKGKPVDNYVVQMDYRTKKRTMDALDKKIYARPLKAWRFDKKKEALTEVPASELKYIKCRRVLVNEKDYYVVD